MSAGERWTGSRRVTLAALCVLAWSFAPSPAFSTSVDRAVPASAGNDSMSGVPRDTTAAAAGDTLLPHAQDTIAGARTDSSAARIPADSSATRKSALWTMDELKRVLREETGGIGEGQTYRERRSGRVAMACAVLVPGLGQMYNGKPLKAALTLGLETFYVSQIAMNRRLWAREKIVRDGFPQPSAEWNYHNGWVTEYWERSVDWIWWSGVVVLGIVIDAYVDAKLDDMRFKVEARASAGNVGVNLLVRY
jgi:hypothetical protein